MAQPLQDPINLLNMRTEVGTRYAAMSMAVLVRPLVRPVLLQLRTLPDDHTSQPGRLSLFQGVRAGNLAYLKIFC